VGAKSYKQLCNLVSGFFVAIAVVVFVALAIVVKTNIYVIALAVSTNCRFVLNGHR